MKRVSRVMLTGILLGLSLSTAACGRRPLAPPPNVAPYAPPEDPYLPPANVPSAAPDPEPTATATPTDPAPSATAPTPGPTDPAPGPTSTPPPEPPPPGPPVQPATDVDFWTMVAKMGFTQPKDEIRKQIVEAVNRTATGWSPGNAGSVATSLANKFADNQKYFVEPPATVEAYSQRGLAFATKRDANTSYYVDLRYSLKGGGTRALVLKFDQATFEVLGTTTKSLINWYTQWKGTLKLPSYLYIPPTVYQPDPAGVSAAMLRQY
ncbi:MAG: hypothetical protein H7338_02900 [Candidatus Sericytochromatia bacterium]|nr:hypothetical protein [Candidatus Sericytochromatia bacterium]